MFPASAPHKIRGFQLKSHGRALGCRLRVVEDADPATHFYPKRFGSTCGFVEGSNPPHIHASEWISLIRTWKVAI
jgi:hypothetical protein